MWFSKGNPKMHGPFDTPQQRWNSRGLTFVAHRWGTQNLPYSRGGSTLLGKEPELPEIPKATSLPEYPEIPEPTEPSEWTEAQPAESTKWTDTLSTSPPPCPVPQPRCHPSQKAKKSQREIGADLGHAAKFICSYLQKNEWVPGWWREFWYLLCTKDEYFGIIQVKGMAHQQAMTFTVPGTPLEKDGWWAAPTCLVC